MKTFNFTTEQKGYGRQGLYFDFNGDSYYVCDVFPNIEEEFSDYALDEDCFYNEEADNYTNSNGDVVTPIDSWDEFLTEHYKEEIGRVLFENDAFEDIELGDFNLDDASYEDIAQWALKYEYSNLF